MEDNTHAEQQFEYVDETPKNEGVESSPRPDESAESEKAVKGAEKRKKLMAKKRFKDRYDGRYLRSIEPLIKLTPFIMKDRCDAMVSFFDSIDVTQADKYCRQKVRDGKTYFTILHLILAAYVRTVSQHPEVNRFVSGRRIYARRTIEVNAIVKKVMSRDGEESGIKVWFDPTDTADEVYEKFNQKVREVVDNPDDANGTESLNKALLHMPRFLLSLAIKFLNWLDYHGWIPKSAIRVSPFHGSMIITSMGSLGIPPVYHHIYNFGNLPVFIAFGVKQTIPTINKDGETVPKKIVELKIVVDERICGGYQYASAFKTLKRYLEHPDLLDTKPESVREDIY